MKNTDNWISVEDKLPVFEEKVFCFWEEVKQWENSMKRDTYIAK